VRLEDLEREQASREKELAAERGALAGELRTAYVNGREEQLKMLLNQQDRPSSVACSPITVLRPCAGRAHRQHPRQARAPRFVARENRRGKPALKDLEARQEQELAALKGAQQKRTQAVSAIESQIKTRGGEIKRLESQARSLEKLIADLRKALQSARWRSRRPSSRCAASFRGPSNRARCSRALASARGWLAQVARHADRHGPGREGPGAVRRRVATPTGCPAWAS